MSLAMYFVVRTDLNMSRGKIATQVAHATAELVLYGNHNKCDEWYTKHNQTKIVLAINNLNDMDTVLCRLLEKKLFVAQVCDIGKTEVPEDTFTCIGVGPVERRAVQKILSGLKALK